jgi:hypothetical protein
MNQQRSLLACGFALVLGVALWGGGCASGGSASSSPDDGGGGGDVTTTEGGMEASACTSGQMSCSGKCTDTGTDPKNCGKCGIKCGPAQMCASGTCVNGCASGYTLCSGPAEAGAPDSGAGGSEGGSSAEGGSEAGSDDAGSGEGGADATVTVDSGAGTVDAGAAPYCANLNDDPMNCGGCGVTCGANSTCVGGMCMLGACPAGQKACPASGGCIPNGTCCQTGECMITGEVCTMPGGQCECPSGETECKGSLNACISTSACCTDADCATTNGMKCSTPGSSCTCPLSSSIQCCLATDCPTVPNATMANCSTSANPPANQCSVASGGCNMGCYDLNGKYADGCECCDDMSAHQCTSAAATAQVTPTAPFTVQGVIPEPTGGDWFAVPVANGTATSTFKVSVTLTSTPSNEFVFDLVTGSCTGMPTGCSLDTGTPSSTGDTTWESSNNAGLSGSPPNFKPIAYGTLFIHVRRASTTAPATCDPYTLTVSETM